jgi:nucleoid DNA-binding protein
LPAARILLGVASAGNSNLRPSGRTGRNPKTGVEVCIPAQRVMVFKASDTLKKHLNADD